MGRPEPVVLFAQTILHSQLDEYVDEVLFSEPVVITACEFLEQNAAPSTPNISLVGATSPPSFALEVFVHCDGESRFRRLCQPFLYSHSSSNVLEVEAIVTNHLVLRGTYRSLTLVIYGNTAEDLGQFNIELGLDHSLANIVSSPSEGKLEDLPPALYSSKLSFEESLSSLKPLSFQATDVDLSIEAKKVLHLTLKMYQMSAVENLIPNLRSSVISAISKYVTASTNHILHTWNQDLANAFTKSESDSQEINKILTEACNELSEIWKNVHAVADSNDNAFAFGVDEELPTTSILAELFNRCFPYYKNFSLLDLQCPSQSAVVKVISDLPDDKLSTDGVPFLISASVELGEMSKLIVFCGPIEDPSPVATARRIFKSEHLEDLLSYKATIDLITSSKYSFLQYDTDPYLLSLIQERSFFPLSAALLSSPILHLASGRAAEILMGIASSIESIILSLLFSRSGLSFLLSQPEATELIVLSLQDAENVNKAECITLRQAFVLLSKGFFCRPQEVGIITELHLKVGSAANRILSVPPNSDELLWVLWELCAISRSDSGRQALLALGYFPEAISVLLRSLSSYKDLDSVMAKNGGSPLGLAIFHSAAEILEVLVADSTSSSLKSWIGFAVDLHKALHSSSPGSNRKDAPTRLLEWIDAGVVYQRNGARGLLRYSAILASGGDAHLSSGNVLVSDSMDVENVVADSNSSSDGQVIDNLLGKLVADKYFDGVALCSTSVVQLTTAFRILAFISDDKAVASSLFEEGAITVIYIVLMNCKSMLERLSNSYDYLVDEGAELSSTTELLLDRTHEQAIVDLMIPSLVLLINLLHILRETKEQYRNKKLLNSLLQLHREVSPRLAACAADLSFMSPTFAVGFGVVCHLITSALACWPLYNWAPGLFHFLLENVEATNASVPLGPKTAFSLLCLLGDLFPDEGIWLWKVELPSLSAIRSLSTSTVLGPQVEKEVNWYLHPEHIDILLVRLTPQLDRFAHIIDNFATSALMVIQDMLRIFIVRVASEKIECAVVLLRPIFIWLDDKVDETSLSERDIFKVHQLLQFIVKLAEHPNGKALLWKMGVARILRKLLQNCSSVCFLDDMTFGRASSSSTDDLMLKWRIPLFKSLAYIFSIDPSNNEKAVAEEPLSEESVHECSSIMHHLLMFCQELASSYTFRSAVTLIFSQIHTSNQDVIEKDENGANRNSSTVDNWSCFSSLFKCWKKLINNIGSDQPAEYLVETIYSLTLGAIALSQYGENLEGLLILRYLFGLPSDPSDSLESSGESLNEIASFLKTFEEKICQGFENSKTSVGKSLLPQVMNSIKLLRSILENSGLSTDSVQMVLEEGTDSSSKVARSVLMTAHLMPSLVDVPVNDESPFLFSNAWKVIVDSEEPVDCQEGEFAKRLVWELPDSSDRQLMPGQSARRKLALGENGSRRARDNQVPELTGQFSRGLNTTNASSGHTRRDTFRQRKPNTSRPPSMHVDDYVARERNIDGASSASNIVNSTPRGTLSGRPPSIHVDEFMARQRERQNPVPASTGDAPQVTSQTSLDDNLRAKPENPRQPKADLDDDQEIEIVFDEESGSDDKLPFPQPDDSLQSPPVIIGENSPGPIVETENQENERIPFSQRATSLQKDDESPGIDISSQTAMLSEANDPSERKYSVPSPEKNSFRAHVSPISVSGRSSAQAARQQSSRSRYEKRSPQKFSDTSLSSGSHGHEHRHSNNHPPLPPMPPPISSMPSQNSDLVNRQSSSYSSRDRPTPNASGYPTQSFDTSMPSAFTCLQGQTQYMLAGAGGSSSNDLPNADAKLLWNTFPVNRIPLETFSSGLSARPMPPQPYSTVATQHATMSSSSPATLYNQGSVVQPSPTASMISDSNLGMNSASGSMLASNMLPSFASQFLMGRPSMPTSFFGTPLPQVQLSSALPQNISNSQPSVSSVQPRPPPPPPPPQQPHPSQTLQQLSTMQLPQQDQPLSYPQSAILPQVPLQFPNQLPIPQLQLYHQSQQESMQALRQAGEQSQLQNQNVQGDSFSQQQQDSGINLNQFFSSPEAIQSLLSDREKLCQLLEQNPKLMQMLQFYSYRKSQEFVRDTEQAPTGWMSPWSTSRCCPSGPSSHR
ncbi:hypothetical protein C2845_PM01G37050 [Panicum miliaceum]|uniref:Virilizer N-terminal domain-containing protein n=1 Tax=Panicum miliaceum TaxID=4540 RepID=A0A3L6TT76_PANMI|nr:hypothetical protein C2845_PM01G37050 [Panicum miliaceum]